MKGCCFNPTDNVDDSDTVYMCSFLPLSQAGELCHTGDHVERRPQTVDDFMVACHLEPYTDRVKALGITRLDAL